MSNYNDIEKRRETQRKWRELNREKLREYYRTRYGAGYKKKWRDEKEGQRETERKKRKEYYQRNREEELKKARVYMKEWYKNNKHKVKEYHKTKYAKDRQWMDEFLSSAKCSHCVESDPRCLDFHHVLPKGREKSVSSMLIYSKERILKEISKCIILCANCHRKEHARLRRGITQ